MDAAGNLQVKLNQLEQNINAEANLISSIRSLFNTLQAKINALNLTIAAGTTISSSELQLLSDTIDVISNKQQSNAGTLANISATTMSS